LAVNAGVSGVADSKVWRHGEFLSKLMAWESGLGDKGYQGSEQLLTPFKKANKGKLTPDQEAANAIIATVRITVERTIGRFKNFRCLSTKWRGDHEFHTTVFAVLAQSIELSFETNPLVRYVHPYLEPE